MFSVSDHARHGPALGKAKPGGVPFISWATVPAPRQGTQSQGWPGMLAGRGYPVVNVVITWLVLVHAKFDRRCAQ
jgi:hypothetical protein